MNKNRKTAKRFEQSKDYGDSRKRRAGAKPYSNNRGGKFAKKGSQGTATYEDDSRLATNNPDHYMANPQLVELSGRIPFTNAIGDKVQFLSDNLLNFVSASYSAYKVLNNFKAMPGIEVLETAPTFGLSEDPSSGLNIAAQAYYTHIRENNSGSKNYDAPDIFTYFMAMSSIFSMINWCQRVYGSMRSFNVINKYFAKTIVEAMGVDYDDIAGNLLNFLARLNLNISKVSAFAVPANMAYFAHVASMYLDIYCDSDNIKDQMYMYNPYGFYKYTIDTSATPVHPEGYLKFEALTNPGHLLTANEIFAYLEDMIDRVFYCQDLAVMSGDTLKAYGAGNLITLGQVPYEYRTLIKHDEYVLTQMKNATILGYNYNFPDLYQDNSKQWLMFTPKLSKTYTSAPNSVNIISDFGVDSANIMSVNGEAPDAKMAFEYSRLMVVGEAAQDSTNPLKYEAKLWTGADVVYRLHTYTMTFDSTTGAPDGYDHQYWGSKYFIVSNVNAALMMMRTLTPFNFHPFIGFVVQDGTTHDLQAIGDCFSYNNYTVVPNEQLKEMHRIALYNMLAHSAVESV